MKNIFIDLLAFGSLLSSVLVITSKNPVIAVIFLISVFVISLLLVNWPNFTPTSVSDTKLDPMLHKVSEMGSNIDRNILSSNSSSFTNFDLSDFNIFKDFSFDKLINFVLQLFRPVKVEGHLDDLLGLQLFIYFLLLVIVISLIGLTIIYMFVNILLHNKELIINKFNNKFLKFMVKYQLFLGKISIFTLPLLILFGLIELAVGLHYLITHPIAWEELPIDLHTYISSTKSK